MASTSRKSLVPFVMTILIVALDQVTKALIVANIKLGTIAWSAMGDFFWLVRQQNTGVAFSMGDSLGVQLRTVLFIALPLILVVGLVIYYFRSDEPTGLQRWLIAGIVAGGLGNLIDRIFRPLGVVDFLSFKFYGLFGLERWPTFNVADMSTFCSVILLAITLVFYKDQGIGKRQA
ncbi:MAG TPA: signal peptidase II [Rectinemataceae bacterium]|nr:signal peptidase II [Rectinemataceae bacterium]